MSVVTVNLIDTFDEWRVKTNTLGSETGDLTTLATTAKGSIVAAVNELANDNTDLENVVEDTTPQLGGHLDLNGNNIGGTGNVSIIGSITATSFSGVISITNDPNPQLGANLDLDSNDITGTGNINITGGVTASGAVAGATLSGTWSGNLNGDMVLNSNDITGTGNINITGSLTATSIAGTVTGVTQSIGDNSTKLATTAYVIDAVALENTLEEMNDTVITTPTNGQQLVYNAATSKWLNSTPTSAGATEGFAVAVAIALG
jgi:hypothetical protein